jgi:ubiquitin C-terminal hydrolase
VVILKYFKQDNDYNQAKVDEYLKQGEQVYELYSIVVHSGTATSGHYYAYIKSFEDGNII